MTPEQKETLIQEWISAQEAWDKNENSDNLHWAIEKLIHLPEEDPESTWDVILGILEKDPSDKIIDILAASPLEDLMTYHGEKYINHIEDEIKHNTRLKKCMRGVWLDSKDTPVWKKFYELAEIEPPFPEKNA